MQFKRPEAYLSNSKKAKIIQDRNSLSLKSTPHALFFKLRDKQKEHADYQHNVLYNLKNVNGGNAAYVCPLFLYRQEYSRCLHRSALLRHWLLLRHPLELKEIRIHERTAVRRFEAIPIFAEHISIPPHAEVHDASQHSYSFDEHGNGVCFHSPESVPNGAILFSQWLKEMYGDFREKKMIIKPDEASDRLVEWIEKAEISVPYDIAIHQKDGIAAWLAFGTFLKRIYNIEQYAFIQWQWD